MQFNIIFKKIFEYIHKKFRFVHTNTFCKYRKKLRASPRVHLVTPSVYRVYIEIGISETLVVHTLYMDVPLGVSLYLTEINAPCHWVQ